MASGVRRTLGLLSVVLILLAIGVGGFAVHEEDWSVIDCLYFSTVALTAVGYGCISPTTEASRRFCLFYLLLGVPAFPVCSSLLLEPVFRELHRVVMHVPRRCVMEFVERTGVGTTWLHDDPRKPPSAAWFLVRGVFSNVLFTYVLGCIFAPTFLLFDEDQYQNSLGPNMSITDAFYFTYVTAATVGFGDICPVGQGSRVYAIFNVLVGVTAVGHLITKLSLLYAAWERAQVRAKQLKRELDVDLIVGLDKSGNGVDQLEFVCGMLTACKIVDEDTIELFKSRFDALDTDKSGILNRDDLAMIPGGLASAREAAIEADLRGSLSVSRRSPVPTPTDGKRGIVMLMGSRAEDAGEPSVPKAPSPRL